MCEEHMESSTKIKSEVNYLEIDIKEEPVEFDTSDKVPVNDDAEVECKGKIEINSRIPVAEVFVKTLSEGSSLQNEDEEGHVEDQNFSSLNEKCDTRNSEDANQHLSSDSDKAQLTITKDNSLSVATEDFTSYCNKVLSQHSDSNTYDNTKCSLFENGFKGANNQFYCEFCNKPFSRKSNLDNHTRIHTRMRPYSCDICKKTFSVKSTLYSHMRVHTGERPYICNICMKTYSQNHHLQDHMRTHTGQRPYVCELCNKSYTRSSSARKHTMRVHANNCT